ncbi:MAG: hypothetical protein PHW79_00705 [Candidatus Marinimicrobia bacterium]|jgi:NAD(P)H-nitrite reductase large subunit|nr:hypothetical protein [Candidatus Neomarinimicrobiota bacterium]
MAKRVSKGFGDKNAKALKDSKKHCAVCGEPIELVKRIMTVTDNEKNSVRFQEKMVGVCKCNRSEIYK